MDVNEVLETYSKKIQEEIGNPYESKRDLSAISKDYESFKKDMMPELSKYEKRVKFLGNIITIKLSLKDETKLVVDMNYLSQKHKNVNTVIHPISLFRPDLT